MEQTLIIFKPDAVQRSLMGQLMTRFETKGFRMVACKMIQMSEELASQHYAEHRDREFFPGLIKFITSGPVLVQVYEGLNAVKAGRLMIGATNPLEAAPGTIRHDFAQFRSHNLVHASDSVDSADREKFLFFKPEEILTYSKVTDSVIF